MKKPLVFFLSFIYLVLSSGFTKSSHYCMWGQTESLSISISSLESLDKSCSICLADKGDTESSKLDCCTEETRVVLAEKTTKKISYLENPVKFLGAGIPIMVSASYLNFNIRSLSKVTSSYLFSKGPIQGNPLYKVYCVYRI